MRYLIDDHMDRCTEAEVMRLLSRVSAQRREQALQYRHLTGRWACLRSWEMLSELLGYPSPEWVYNEHGCPRIEGGPCFSISHCREAIIVAVDEAPIGVDIECSRRVTESLIRYTMNDEEVADILSAEEREQRFLYYWTRKEAWLKRQGTGITGDMRSVLDTATEIDTYITDNYIYSITKPK